MVGCIEVELVFVVFGVLCDFSFDDCVVVVIECDFIIVYGVEVIFVEYSFIFWICYFNWVFGVGVGCVFGFIVWFWNFYVV